MPAIRIFGRKWLTATDDLVFPCIFELFWRMISFIFMSIVLHEYWMTMKNEFYDKMEAHDSKMLDNSSLFNCQHSDILQIAIYLFGFLALMITNLVILSVMTNQSSKGSITDTISRRHVTSLLYVKYVNLSYEFYFYIINLNLFHRLLLLLPDITLNVIGTMWSYSDPLRCEFKNDSMSATIVRGKII